MAGDSSTAASLRISPWNRKEKMEQNKVLVIDDEPSLRKLVEITLARQGIAVTSLAGVRIGDNLEGFGPNFNGELDPHLYSVAVVDGDLGEKSARGWEIVPFLLKAGVTCIAFAAVPESQQRLMEAGCWRPLDKANVVYGLPEAVKEALELRSSTA
jgi:CheY-like chemotaxis protein